MIGVDTNVLARLFLEDDREQASLAREFFAERSAADPAYVSTVVIVELVWLLTSRYRYPGSAVHEVLDAMFASANVLMEREELVRRTANSARRTGADIADAIVAALAEEAGCQRTVTFDAAAAKRVESMELLQ